MDALEGARKMKWVHTHAIGDLANEKPAGLQKTGCLIHFQPLQKSIRRLPVKAREESAKISHIDMAGRCRLPDRGDVLEVLLQVASAAFKGLKSRLCRGSGGHAC